jgi:hypothetical protein
MMTEQILFPLGSAPGIDLEQAGGMNVAVDETFATAQRIQFDSTSWVDHGCTRVRPEC